MLKSVLFKIYSKSILKTTPTCFGPCRIPHQGLINCTWLKLHIMVQLYMLLCVVQHITACTTVMYNWTIIRNFSQVQFISPWWWILCGLKHVVVVFRILLEWILNSTDFNIDYNLYNWVHKLVNKVFDTNDARWRIEDEGVKSFLSNHEGIHGEKRHSSTHA
jgi:hypothetical protein